MSSLVVGGVAIPVAPGSGSWDWSDATDRRRAFDNTYRASATGGAARDGRWTTPPVTRANAAIYRAALQKVDAQLCTGDLIEIPTMCCAEFITERPVKAQVGSYLQLDFALHEVQGKRLLLKYSPGDTITGESFSRSTTAYQIGAGGTLNSVAINTKRDSHWIGGFRHILLEDARTNNLLWSNDLSNAAWVKTSCTISTGVADPAGGTGASVITATGANSHCIQTLAAGSNVARTNSVWLRRRTGVGSVFLRDSPNTGFVDVNPGLLSTWTRFFISAAASTGRILDIQIATSGDAVDVWCAQNEEGTFKSSEIPTTTVAVTRGADFYSLPFPYPPQEMTVYAKFVEGGTIATGNAVFAAITATPGFVAPFFLVQSLGTTILRCFHDATFYSDASLPLSIGDVGELRANLFGDGSILAGGSKNGATEIVGAQSAPSVLEPAWSAQTLWLNGTSSGTVLGFTAIQSLKIVAGARSLSDMRAA